MRKALLGSVSLLLTGAGLALGQAPATPAAPGPQAAESGPAGLPPAAGTPVGGNAGGAAATELIREAPMPAAGRVYVDAEYLLWFTRPTKLPALVLAGNSANPSGLPPAVGQPGTSIVIGNEDVNAGTRSGVRVRAGAWFNPEETFGLEAGGFLLESIGAGFTTASGANGSPTLGLSFGDAGSPPADARINPFNETSLLIASPGQTAGASTVTTATRFWGAELNAMCSVAGGSCYRADMLVGVRYLRLNEALGIASISTALEPTGSVEFLGPPPHTPPASVTITDSFRTRNDFYGGNVGAHIQLQKHDLFADFRATIAPGVTHESVVINGATSLITPQGTTTVPGGLLAQPTNIGHHTRDEFTLVPEAGAMIGLQLTTWLRVYGGYSVTYWWHGVLRPSTEIDRQVNTTAIPVLSPAPLGTEGHPAPQLRKVDFWGQGATFGVELAF